VRANELPPVPGSVHKKKRIGRGNSSGHGTYSGRGIKGQKSRSGPDLRIGFEGGQIPLVRALSRKRGFNNRFRVEFEPVNVSQLNKLPAGTTVTSASLRSAGIVKSARLPVKVLGDGEISVALTVEVEKVSATARAKIEAAGGTATALMPDKVKNERRSPTAASQPSAAAAEAPAAAEQPSAAQPRRGRAPAAEAAETPEATENAEEAAED
jgi:large subunit ribosomal protein L15